MLCFLHYYLHGTYLLREGYNDNAASSLINIKNIWYSACLPLWSDCALLWTLLGRLYNGVFSSVRGSRGFTTPRSADMNTKYNAPVHSEGRGHFQRGERYLEHELQSMLLRNCLLPKHLCFSTAALHGFCRFQNQTWLKFYCSKLQKLLRILRMNSN